MRLFDAAPGLITPSNWAASLQIHPNKCEVYYCYLIVVDFNLITFHQYFIRRRVLYWIALYLL